MTGSVTTAMCASFKSEAVQGMHCFAGQQAPTGNLTNLSQAIASLSATTGLVHGMGVTGTGVPTNTFLINTGGTFSLSLAATATNTGVTLTCSGDVFKAALIIASPTGTYGSGSTNYSNVTGNSDEVSGTGYTAGGFAWTAAQITAPAVSSAAAYWSMSTNPTWTSASFSTSGMLMYNSTYRSATNNRAVAAYSFGGTQTVTAGTFTVLLPTNAVNTAMLQLS